MLHIEAVDHHGDLEGALQFLKAFPAEGLARIVGEVVLASFGEFSFQFDPVFARVPVLPLVPQSSFLEVDP